MSYVSLSDKDRREMLERIGVGSTDDLFCCIPEGIRLTGKLALPDAMPESALVRHLEGMARENTYANICPSSEAGPTTISFRRSWTT
jgi:glycine dehydrogenase subunit 1